MKDQVVKVGNLFRNLASMGFHVLVLVLSAGIALSLPWVARHFLALWSHVENEKILLVSVEIAAAAVLVLFINNFRRSRLDRQLAQKAAGAGLVSFFPGREDHARKKSRRLKEQHGMGRSVMVIGFTGFSTFADPESDLHQVVQNSLEAKIMLANPYSDQVRTRVQRLPHLDCTYERTQDEVLTSIELLKRLKAAGKAVKLKLYSDSPLVRLAILGEYVWLQSYHTGLDVGIRPEYVFQHDLQEHGLYALWYHYFLERWESPEIPEYDLDRDELVYRGGNRSEESRERFGKRLESGVLQRPLADLSLTPDAVSPAGT